MRQQPPASGSPEPYEPNVIPLITRIFYVAAALAVFAYGAYGVVVDDLFLPAKRSDGMHLHGVAAWLAFAAIACMAANLLSVVADHFDKRDNERSYRRFARITSWAGWICFGLSLVIYLMQRASGPGAA
jgi:hypothetical protein